MPSKKKPTPEPAERNVDPWDDAVERCFYAVEELAHLADDLDLVDAESAVAVLQAAMRFLGPEMMRNQQSAERIRQAANIVRGGNRQSAGGATLRDYVRAIDTALTHGALLKWSPAEHGAALRGVLAAHFGGAFLKEDPAVVGELATKKTDRDKRLRTVALELAMRAATRERPTNAKRWFLLPVAAADRVGVQKRISNEVQKLRASE